MSQSLLATDGYKFSMQEAGWPLRRETFYYSHRKGGPQLVPLDIEKFIRDLLPKTTQEDYAFLTTHEYEMGIGFRAAIEQREKVVVRALPKGTVFYPREPVFSVTGPSALVSWLEPLALQLHFRIQIATLAVLDPEALARAVRKVTCPEMAEIVRETLDGIGRKCPPMEADMNEYSRRVQTNARRIVQILRNPERAFEVGMRSATCMQEHEIALMACQKEGIQRTSNVYLAKKLGMVPVGTMGHEHLQRYGADEPGFRAMRDRRPYRSSYLPDTYDVYLSGIPAAFKVMMEEPEKRDSIRYDSGDKLGQYLYVVSKGKLYSLQPRHIFEDELDDEKTETYEGARTQVSVSEGDQFYGYGRFFVSSPAFSGLTRDTVAAVYKLCETGPYPTMKFASEAKGGKESVPGMPVIFRRTSANGPHGIIGQFDEDVPEGYALLTGNEPTIAGDVFTLQRERNPLVVLSPATKALRHKLMEDLRGMKVGLL